MYLLGKRIDVVTVYIQVCWSAFTEQNNALWSYEHCNRRVGRLLSALFLFMSERGTPCCHFSSPLLSRESEARQWPLWSINEGSIYADLYTQCTMSNNNIFILSYMLSWGFNTFALDFLERAQLLLFYGISMLSTLSCCFCSFPPMYTFYWSEWQ